MANKNEIYVAGDSVLANFIAIYLAEKKIKNNLHINPLDVEQLKPTSNQLINNYSKNLETPYLLSEYRRNIKFIQNTKIIFFNKNINEQAVLSSKYKYPIYAIDNRIRIMSFDHKIKDFMRKDIIRATNQLYHETENEIIILGGYKNKVQFESIDNEIGLEPTRVRKFVSINLKVNSGLLEDFNGTTSFLIEEFGEIICYPFLHYSNEVGICMVVNFNINNTIDLKTEFNNSFDTLNSIKQVIQNKIYLLNKLIDNAIPFDKSVFQGYVKPYFMTPANINKAKLYLGVGSAVMNTDPIVGQGYNLGIKLSKMIAETVINKASNKFEIKDTINKYSLEKLGKLRRITDIFTGSNKENPAFAAFITAMITNKNLSSFWFEGIEDIDHYFPWIEDEHETEKILKKFRN